ncbi:MAG: hypothetical protein OXC07_13105 [Kistimonas sp.]|nr:hypothetical protein [Kistimonas sp.]
MNMKTFPALRNTAPAFLSSQSLNTLRIRSRISIVRTTQFPHRVEDRLLMLAQGI